jgi:hypothetical protein
VKQRILSLAVSDSAGHTEDLLSQTEAGRIASLIDAFQVDD